MVPRFESQRRLGDRTWSSSSRQIAIPFHKGHFAANVDGNKCVGCSTCENVCPFSVPKLKQTDSLSDINSEACYGCGVCARNCPEEAISLVEAARTIGY